MRRFFALMTVLMMVWIVPGFAWAVYAPPEGTWYFSAGGIDHETHYFYDEYTGVTHVNQTAYDIFTTPSGPATWNLGFSFFIKWDPAIGYSDFIIKNLTTESQEFSFYMASPIQTVSGANKIFTTMNASISDYVQGNGDFSATHQTFLATGSSAPQTSLSGFDIALDPSILGNTIAGAGPTGDWSYMLVKLSGIVPGGETLTLNGKSEITAVPEPTTVLLLGAGLLGLIGVRRKIGK